MTDAHPARAPSRPRLVRRDEGRAVAGVAGGIADHLGIDPLVVRLAFVVLAVGGGSGILLYLAAWLVMPAGDGPAVVARSREADWLSVAAVGAVVLGILMLVAQVDWWFPGQVIVPAVLASVGIALLWAWPRGEQGERAAAAGEGGAGAAGSAKAGEVAGPSSALPEGLASRLPAAAADALGVLVGTRRGSLVRVAAGGALVVVGIGAFLATTQAFDAARKGLLATAIIVAGLALILGPWLWRLATELGEERRERIRSQERAEMAAHLHDSVLQTLALVQRRADDPREVVRLARRQERELRTWLLGDGTAAAVVAPTRDDEPGSLGTALESLAAEVEEEHGVPVEVVRVRDCPLADDLTPLLAATRETIVNACRHSGAPRVSVYLEVDDRSATVFVRDTGRGFDPEAVAPDRRGLAESIVGRMSRNGGHAAVRSSPGEGTEVELTMPRTTP